MSKDHKKPLSPAELTERKQQVLVLAAAFEIAELIADAIRPKPFSGSHSSELLGLGAENSELLRRSWRDLSICRAELAAMRAEALLVAIEQAR